MQHNNSIVARTSPLFSESASASAIAIAAGVTNRVTRKMRLIRKQQQMTTETSEQNTSANEIHGKLALNNQSGIVSNDVESTTPKHEGFVL